MGGAHVRGRRRTAWGGRRAAVILALGLCGTGLQPAAAATAAPDTGSYAFAPGARAVTGTASPADAPRLDPGRVYRGSLPAHGRLTYRLDLADAAATAYVPVTAVPPAHATVTSTDGIRVSVRDAQGTACSYATARFGAGLSPRPVTALGKREAGRALCQGAGRYSVLVERLDTGDTGTSAPWDLEMAPALEPRLTSPAPTGAPPTRDSASPEPLTGEARERAGGAGFATARPLGQGVWRTMLVPGRTQFYKVPLDWGRRLQASAELGGTPGHGYVGGALDLSLYDPVRGLADDATLGYTGVRAPVALAPLPPVEYANRYAAPAAVSALRFAGDYYLVLHLSDRLTATFGQGPYEVTLRVRVDGRAHAGPGYAGRPEPDGVFTPSASDGPAMAVEGDGGAGADGSAGMRALAAGGIGLGTALLLVLGGWTLAVRRAQTRVSAQKPTA
ncbi:hypothetical protein [Streptomyces sp. KHY 26]|uniref:hypothetical protein n=1 Tax=Streptomyces sp. KHY 26 TaxID=3097359 RepID=UPI00376F17A5